VFGLKKIDYLISVTLVALGFLLFYTFYLSPAVDLCDYIAVALNIYNGNGPVGISWEPNYYTTIRPPGFTGLIALSYWIFGVSFWSAFWVVRFFCVAAPVVIFFVGRFLYGRTAAFVASLLTLSSYFVAFWSYRHLDASWPLFILTAITFTLAAFERRSWLYAIIAGLCFAAAFFLKEIAVIYLPFPIFYVLIVKKFRNRRDFSRAATISAFMLFSALIWMVISKRPAEGVTRGGGLISEVLAGWDGKGFPPVVDMILTWSEGLLLILKRVMYFSALTPLFIIAWGYTFWRAIRGAQTGVALSLAFFLFTPLIVLFGIRDMRLGQSLLWIYLSFLALGYMFSAALRFAARQTKVFYRNMAFSTLGILVSILLIVQICGIGPFTLGKWLFNDKGLLTFLGQNRSLAWEIATSGNFKRALIGAIDEKAVDKALVYLEPNLSVGDGIMIDRFSVARSAFITSGGRYRFYNLPLIVYKDERYAREGNVFPIGSPTHKLWNSLVDESRTEKGEIIYYNVIFGNVPVLLYNELLMDVIVRNNIKYVIATNWGGSFSEVLKDHSGFEPVGPNFRDNKSNSAQIYRFIGAAQWGDRMPVVNNPLRARLLHLKENDPEQFDITVDRFLAATNLDRARFIDSLFEVPLPHEQYLELPALETHGFIPGAVSGNMDHAQYRFEGKPGDMVVQYQAYDVDSEIEVEIVLNGRHIGFVPTTEDSQWGETRAITLPQNLIHENGPNVLEFSNTSNPPQTYVWAVRNVSIR